MSGLSVRILEELGRGAYSVVNRAILDDQVVAVKRVFVGRRTEPREHLLKEYEVLSKLEHKNIISVFKCLNTERSLMMFMELGSETLLDRIESSEKPSTKKLQDVLFQLAHALSYLHGKGIIHCDIKPSNIIITSGNVKIIDFGSCKVPSEIKDKGNQNECTPGTRLYKAPEVLVGLGHTTKSDIWSVAVSCIYFYSKKCPFSGDSDFVVLNDILNMFGTPGRKDWPPCENDCVLRFRGREGTVSKQELRGKFNLESLEPRLCSLFCDMLDVDPHERISSKGICSRE